MIKIIFSRLIQQKSDRLNPNMWPKLQKGILYTCCILWLWRDITSFVSELLGQNFQSYKCNDRTVLLPNFKAVSQTQVELHSLKVEKLDACIRPIQSHLQLPTRFCLQPSLTAFLYSKHWQNVSNNNVMSWTSCITLYPSPWRTEALLLNNTLPYINNTIW